MSITGRGACLCGAVSFETSGKLGSVTACHCSQCRKQSGHIWASTHVEEADIVIEGADNLTWYMSTPGYKRGFCKTCGSALFWKREGSDYLSVGAGTFAAPTGLKLARNIYCTDKGDYYDMTDDLPQFPQSSV